MHPFWSKVTGSLGVLPLYDTPSRYTITFARFPSASTIKDSAYTLSLCDAAHTGSASILSCLAFGAFPT